MTRFFIVGLANGLLFGMLDGLIHGNSLARRLLEVYKPIAKTAINIPAGIVIDLAWGLIMGFVFLLLYDAWPGRTGLVKGLVFALVVWFFRVVMNAASTGMMFNVPAATLVYLVLAGLVEMLILGVVYGLFLKPLKA